MKNKLGLIQVFRGLAALLVVLCHLSGSTPGYFDTSFLGGIFLHGYIGVDFFFVLSGFIITYVHFRDLENGSGKTTFLIKRFVRIYPFYWIIASFYLFLLFLAGGKTTHLDHTISFRSIDDLSFIAGSYLLLPMDSNPLIGVTWSLTYEMLFYFVFFACILIRFEKAKYIILIWASLILAKIFFPSSGILPDGMLFNERILEFLVGCIVAYAIRKSYVLNGVTWMLLIVSGCILFYMIYPGSLKLPIGILVLAYVMGILVFGIVSIDVKNTYVYPKWLLLMGEASYSIYLSHLILISIFLRVFKFLVDQLSIQSFLLLQFVFLLMFVLIVYAGILIYRFVEAPLLEYLNKKVVNNSRVTRQVGTTKEVIG